MNKIMNRAKSILFVLPSLKIGGTTSSMMAILNSSMVKDYHIDVFFIVDVGGINRILSPHNIGKNELTTAYYGTFINFNMFRRLKYLPIKILKQFSFFREVLEKKIVNATIRSIEKDYHYDYVVGFEERFATSFATHFSCGNKVAWVHCDYYSANGPLSDEDAIYQEYSKIVCVSNYTRGRFLEVYPSLTDKTVAIHNVFDVDNILKMADEQIEDSRFDNSLFTIISLGRINEVKRFCEIPVIAQGLKGKGADFRWYILGKDDGSDELDKLLNAIQEHHVEKEVIYLGSKSNPYPYLKASDMMVTVSRSEACPMIFNESKILHVPIVSTDFGSAFEFICQGGNGYIASLSDMTSQIYDLMKDSSKLENMRNFAFVDDNDLVIEQLKALFE